MVSRYMCKLHHKLKNAKKKIPNSLSQDKINLDLGQWILNTWLKVDNGQLTVDSGQLTVDSGQLRVDSWQLKVASFNPRCWLFQWIIHGQAVGGTLIYRFLDGTEVGTRERPARMDLESWRFRESWSCETAGDWGENWELEESLWQWEEFWRELESSLVVQMWRDEVKEKLWQISTGGGGRW